MAGIRILAWYQAPKDVEYLFELGETSLIGEPVGLMTGAAFGLPLHSFHFQKIKKIMFLKAASCIYY